LQAAKDRIDNAILFFGESMRHAIVALVIAGGAALAPLAGNAQQSAAAGAQSAARYKVVLQVSDADPAKWNLALNNARNIQQDLGNGKVEIEIVAYGPGLAMLKADSKVADRLGQALDNSIGLLACENTMRNTKVTKEQMYSGISYVDAGVVHIMKRQREGWAYIRP
jgi:intracellular sulfur oxidation DsrE/DsrF family protein